MFRNFCFVELDVLDCWYVESYISHIEQPPGKKKNILKYLGRKMTQKKKANDNKSSEWLWV